MILFFSHSNRIPFVFLFFSSLFFFFLIILCFACVRDSIYSSLYSHHSVKLRQNHTKHMLIVISDTSFESGLSEDYAIPPDALSQAESTYMDASLPSILMRSSYVDSPNKKMESLEKVNNTTFFFLLAYVSHQNETFD